MLRIVRLSDGVIFRNFPLLVFMMVCAPIVQGMHLPARLDRVYTYGIYGALALFSFLYFYRHNKRLLNEHKVLSRIYLGMLAYVVIGWVKLIFVPSGMYPFFIYQMNTAFIYWGSIFILMNEKVVNRTLRLYWRWLPLVFLGTVAYCRNQYCMFTFAPALFYLCFWMFLSWKRRLLSLALVTFMAYYGMRQRIDYIDILVPVIMVGSYYSLRGRTVRAFYWFNTIMVLPVIFLLLALTGAFNVLDFDSYIKEDISTASAGRFTDDTRTFLYVESINSAIKNGYVLQGRTPCYGYDSYWVQKQLDMDKKSEAAVRRKEIAQRASEVATVNIFTWCGLFGLCVFAFCFYYVGYKGIKRAKNTLLRMLCIYVSLFWLVSWIGHIFFAPAMDYMTLFIVIAIISSRKIQSMTNKEIKLYFTTLLK